MAFYRNGQMSRMFAGRISLWFVLLLLVLLTGCTGEIEVHPGKISEVSVKEFHDEIILLDVIMSIENKSSHKIVVRKLTSDIFVASDKIGTVTTEEKVIITPESVGEYRVPVKIEHEDFGKITKSLLASVFHGGRIDMEMKGVLYVRSGLLFKKIRFNEKQQVPVFR